MSKHPRIFTNNEKAKIALEAMRGEKTIAQISSEFEVHPTQIGLWKKQALENLPASFENTKKKEREKESEHQKKIDELHRIIGQRDAELEWMKKTISSFSP
jgi:transposase